MSSLGAAAGLVQGVHVADWLVPTTDLVAGRGLPGDGIIDVGRILRTLDDGGYTGWIEVEVLNAEVWSRPTGDVVADVQNRMARLFAEAVV
jgi:sugar phosphate isomerase/epimerase